MAFQHVIIIGAGLGGLTLGQGLKKAGISFSIFERDETAAFRPQGYRLRINGDGSSSLRKTLPSDVWELFEKTTARTNLGFTSLDPFSGNVTSYKPGPGPPRPGMPTENPSDVYTCDRATLRAVLGTIDQVCPLENRSSIGHRNRHLRTHRSALIAFVFC